MKFAFASRVATMVSMLAASLMIAPGAEAVTTTTVDFSTVGQGPFDATFFSRNGITFTDGAFVGFIQGDDALVGPVAGSVRGGYTRICAQVAPSFQGTATYTLTAFKHQEQIAATSRAVTQDIGDPNTEPPGYFTICSGPMPKRADSFALSGEFVRSTFPDVQRVDFGVSSITFWR